MRQWVTWALGHDGPPDEVWLEGGRCFDPFRPAIEPGGFDSPEELLASRAVTLRAIRRAVVESGVFVFTLGLTEAWVNERSGYVYPMCPGTLQGEFDLKIHRFVNLRHSGTLRDMHETIEMVTAVNPHVKFLLTVSPVPPTATASGDHVLVATTHSKSTLRSVAAELCENPVVDYFPSFEIVTGLPCRAMHFEGNLRSVSSWGVDFVMSHFFRALGTDAEEVEGLVASKDEVTPNGADRIPEDDEVECEDALLQAFASGGAG